VVLFTRAFYADCRRALTKGGVLVTQNGLPFLQGSQLKRSVAYFRDLFADGFAYLATTPSHVGGPLSFGWATDNEKLRQHSKKKIEKRYDKAPFETRYWRPNVHVAAFALPIYVLELISDC
jgi:spermidine synthase